MILQSLVQYYEALERKGEITKPGWTKAKVSYALEITEEGELRRVIPLKEEAERGKKKVLVPQNINVPQMETRSSGVKANFLCDNTSYLLGIDSKGKPQRSIECFEAAKARHLAILSGVDCKEARAVVRYFENWKPEEAQENPVLSEDLEDMMAGAQDEEAGQGICLVTGRRDEIARIHATIKGVQGAQSSGAALVSFNASAFESYGKEQSYNAPVGMYAAYAYTTALNHLIADRKHTTIIGDATVVYWSEDGEEAYQDVFAAVSEPSIDNQEIVDGVFKNLAADRAVVAEDVQAALSMDRKFYILGLAPNAARLAVRFFYQDSFGNILKNIKAHYDRMEIVKPAMDQAQYLGIWRMLQETVNKKSRDKKPAPNMAGSVFRAILSGSPYPAALYQAVLGRIKAEQDDSDAHIRKITRGRAAVIKAYILRNTRCGEEEATVALNENSNNVAYTLGREFSVLEAIQEDANPSINATIKDKYFNSACATPAVIFPVLLKLSNSHIRKLGKGKQVHYEKLLGSLQDKLEVGDGAEAGIPKSLTLEEQGMFILGYYHQTQKRYEKKAKEEIEDGGDN